MRSLASVACVGLASLARMARFVRYASHCVCRNVAAPGPAVGQVPPDATGTDHDAGARTVMMVDGGLTVAGVMGATTWLLLHAVATIAAKRTAWSARPPTRVAERML